MATRNRLELSTSSVTGWRSNQLNYRAIYVNGISPDYGLQGQKESNPRHAVLETAALPAELYPYIRGPSAPHKTVGLHGLEPWTVRL